VHPRRELAIGLAAFVALGVIFLAEALTAPAGTLDPRLSTYRAEPNGARAWADGLERLGQHVVRWRRPFSVLPVPSAERAVLAVLAPDMWLDFADQGALRRWARKGGDLLLVGQGSRLAMACAGWRWDTVGVAGVPGTGDVEGTPIRIPVVRARLVPIHDSLFADTTRLEDLGLRSCSRGPRGAVDTLLRGPSGVPLAVRVHTPAGPRVTLVADAELFTNSALRGSPAGEFALALIPPGTPELIVDEYHHRYGADGSLSGAILSWSRQAPLGWILWQMAVVGLIALLAAMVRSGPTRSLPGPSRRSALEHVGALAHALAATKGHDVAVVALVRGLRRRLSTDGRPVLEDPRGWLEGLRDRVRSGNARRAVARLLELTRSGQGAAEVLAAANAVEEIWQELRP
jgi:hypothetical protein